MIGKGTRLTPHITDVAEPGENTHPQGGDQDSGLLVAGTCGKSLEEGPEFVERLSESLKISGP